MHPVVVQHQHQIQTYFLNLEVFNLKLHLKQININTISLIICKITEFVFLLRC